VGSLIAPLIRYRRPRISIHVPAASPVAMVAKIAAVVRTGNHSIVVGQRLGEQSWSAPPIGCAKTGIAQAVTITKTTIQTMTPAIAHAQSRCRRVVSPFTRDLEPFNGASSTKLQCRTQGA
jgi:hypothetical protein